MGTLRPPLTVPAADSPRIARQTSNPSIPGMRMSSTTRSGFSRSNVRSAARPSAASATSNPLRRSAKQTTSRMWGVVIDHEHLAHRAILRRDRTPVTTLTPGACAALAGLRGWTACRLIGVLVEMAAGGVAVFSSTSLHRSGPNNTAQLRRQRRPWGQAVPFVSNGRLAYWVGRISKPRDPVGSAGQQIRSKSSQ